MMDRIAPVADKVYLKTLKGKEPWQLCSEKAKIVGAQLTADDDSLYCSLTNLEATCDGLLKQTCEFRIKAG